MKNSKYLLLVSLLIFGCSKTDSPTPTPTPTPPTPTPETIAPTFASLNKTSGRSGDVIVLSGNGFSTVLNENQVVFAGTTTSATVKTATNSDLTVEVPQGAATGVVTVKVKNVSAKLAAGFDGKFVISPTVQTPSGNATLELNDKLKTHLDFAANDGAGNFFTINTTGPSHEYYKVLRINSSGAISKTYEPTEFGGTAGTNLRINGITNDLDGNVYVAVGLSTFRYTKAEGRLYVINKGTDQPVFVMNLIGKDLEYFDVSDYFDDMVITSKKELYISDASRIYHVPTSGIITPYIDYLNTLKSTNMLVFPGLTIDKNDNLYFTAVNGNGKLNNIYKADPAKNLTKLYSATDLGFADGALASAKFDVLNFLAVDAAGKDLYISDGRQFRLRKLDLTTNMVTTVAGTGKQLGIVMVNGAFVVNASGNALEATTAPTKLSLNEKQKIVYLQNLNDSYFQLFKY